MGDYMCALKVQLKRDEEVVFESERAVLTNQRLLANLDRKNIEQVTDDVPLTNVLNFEKSNGGRESRTNAGFKVLGAGLLVMLIQVVLASKLPSTLPDLLELLLFLAASAAIVIGIYFLLDGVLRIKPFTTVMFKVMDSRDVHVYFDGMFNTEADELTRLYVRTRRDMRIS
jgi:hypothetical protein